MNRYNGVMIFSDGTYNVVKWIALYLLPAIQAAYFSLGALWGIPNTDKVVGTIAILNILLSTAVGLSRKIYSATGGTYDGTITVKTNLEDGTTALHLSPSDELNLDKGRLTFKVN